MNAFPFKSVQLSNNGPLLLLIGGVNTQERHWKPYIDLLSDAYKIVCVSLSEDITDKDCQLSIVELNNIIISMAEGHKTTAINIISFSMGSRVAFSLLEHIPQSIGKVLCIAPDGIKTHPLFYLSTQTRLGQSAFKYVVNNMGILYRFCALGCKLHLVNNIFLSLSSKLKQDKVAAKQLYYYWMIFGKLKPLWRSIREHIEDFEIDLTFLFGSSDVFISNKLSKDIEELVPEARVYVLDVGHYLKDNLFINHTKLIFLPD